MKVTIKKTGINGEGIGYIDRMPVFVPQALIGEEVEIRIVDKQKRYATAELLRVVKSSKNRIRPKCFIQNTCGACPLMIARYPAQLEYKQDLLKQSLIKYAQIDPRKVARVKASEDVFGYRNQFKLPCAMEEGRLVSGLFMPNSNYFIDVKKCWIHEDGLERVRMDIMRVLNTHGCVSYNPHDKKGIRNLVVRGFDNRYQCTIVTGNDELDDRIRPKCFIQNTCGACPLMIARYPAQLEYKQDLLKQSLIKYAQIDPRKVARVKASEDVFGYRNQFKLPCAMEEGRLVSGLFMPNSNYFIDVKKCWIHEDGLERVRMDIMRVLNTHGCVSYNPHDKKGIRNLVVRGFDNRYQCTIVTGNDELDERLVSDLMRIKGLTSLWQSIHTIKKTPEVFGNKMMHLAGEASLAMELDGLKLRISPRSFFQLNSKQAVQLKE